MLMRFELFIIYIAPWSMECVAAFSSFSLSNNPGYASNISVFTNGESFLDAKIKVTQEMS